MANKIQNPFSVLPAEVAAMILERCNDREVSAFSQVDQTCYHLAQSAFQARLTKGEKLFGKEESEGTKALMKLGNIDSYQGFRSAQVEYVAFSKGLFRQSSRDVVIFFKRLLDYTTGSLANIREEQQAEYIQEEKVLEGIIDSDGNDQEKALALKTRAAQPTCQQMFKAYEVQAGMISRQERDFWSNRNMRVMPRELGLLTNLTGLPCFGDRLVEIPDVFSEFTQLAVCDFTNNCLHTLPPSLIALNSLQTLYIGGNPIKSRELERILRKIPDLKILSLDLQQANGLSEECAQYLQEKLVSLAIVDDADLTLLRRYQAMKQANAIADAKWFEDLQEKEPLLQKITLQDLQTLDLVSLNARLGNLIEEERHRIHGAIIEAIKRNPLNISIFQAFPEFLRYQAIQAREGIVILTHIRDDAIYREIIQITGMNITQEDICLVFQFAKSHGNSS